MSRAPVTSHHPLSITHHTPSGFTLIEILAVLTVITIFAGVIGFSFRGSGSETVGLQSAQSIVVSLLTSVRGQAALSGRDAALFVNVQSTDGEEYCRHLIPALRNESDTGWVALSDGAYLPPGTYVVPFTTPTGDAVEGTESWSGLNSSRLVTTESDLLPSVAIESWIGVVFTARGTPTPSVGVGDRVVVANGRKVPTDSSYPFVFVNRDNVRGVSVSIYGGITLLNSRDDIL